MAGPNGQDQKRCLQEITPNTNQVQICNSSDTYVYDWVAHEQTS